MAETPTSLETFAKQRGGHHGAGMWLESLPEATQQEVLKGWQNGLRGTVICEWLVAAGHQDATEAKVTRFCREKLRG